MICFQFRRPRSIFTDLDLSEILSIRSTKPYHHLPHFPGFQLFSSSTNVLFCVVNKFVATNNFSHKKRFQFGVQWDSDNEDGNTNNIPNDSVYTMDSLWRRLRDGWFSFLYVDAYYRNKTIHIDLKSENMLIFVDAMSKVVDVSQVIVKFWFFN